MKDKTEKLSSKDSSIELMEKDTTIKFLRQEADSLRKEVVHLRKLLQSYDIEDESLVISDTELICLQQINKLKALSENVILSKDEVAALDTLYKNLRICQGDQSIKDRDSKKIKKLSNADLLKLVN